MSWFRTETPPYQGQSPTLGKRRESHRDGPLEWLASLFRTATPSYQSAPKPTESGHLPSLPPERGDQPMPDVSAERPVE